MKDTRGVVMMEYIVLGLFCVAITVVAVATLGQAYSNGLIINAYATLGENVTEELTTARHNITSGAVHANTYASSFLVDENEAINGASLGDSNIFDAFMGSN